MDIASMASNASALNSANQKDMVENPKGIIDKDGFLKLLIAQLKYQDPLNPLNNNQFIQENTGFSQLEQLQNISNSINSFSSKLGDNDKSYAASYLGKYIATNSNSISVNGSKTTPLSFNLSNMANVQIGIVNSKGENIANIDLGNLSKGVHNFTWNGKDNEGNYVPDGKYTAMLFAKSPDGTEVPIEENAGKVIAVQFDASGVVFVTDQNKHISINDVKSVF